MNLLIMYFSPASRLGPNILLSIFLYKLCATFRNKFVSYGNVSGLYSVYSCLEGGRSILYCSVPAFPKDAGMFICFVICHFIRKLWGGDETEQMLHGVPDTREFVGHSIR